MRAGVYNFGFFAADNSPEAIKAISWWAKRLETLCVNRQKEGIFVDQKWMDLLPGRHGMVKILRHNGYNVAYWNLSHRKIAFEQGNYYCNGEPLVFFHFSGFNSLQPNQISKHQNRFSMSDVGAASRLFREYAAEILSNHYHQWRQKKYAWSTFVDGRPVLDIYRHLYRQNEIIRHKTGSKNPFCCPEVFYDQKEQLTPILINYILTESDGIGVYMINSTRTQWVQWFHDRMRDFKLNEEWIDYATSYFKRHLSGFVDAGESVEKKNKHADVTQRKPAGVNLIGYITSEHGLGEACRLTAAALNTTGISWLAYDWETGNPSRQTDYTWKSKIQEDVKYSVSIFNINADQLSLAKKIMPAGAWQGYRIGIWFWELTKFPLEWREAFDLVDEIWAPTRFIQETLEAVSPIPVIHMPSGIRRPKPERKFDRKYFRLPEKPFLFLNYFDAFSYASRKNPFAAIQAFKDAFQKNDERVGLVLKINNAGKDDENICALQKEIDGYQNIFIIPRILSRDEMNALINVCDASVSLHRSEGLGLLCQESMFYGKPVIATAWSGNMDFMTEDSACLVDYDLIPIGDYYGNNDPDQYWADPYVHQATEYMQKLVNDPIYYARISGNAEKQIAVNFSPEVCGARMKKRLERIFHEQSGNVCVSDSIANSNHYYEIERKIDNLLQAIDEVPKTEIIGMEFSCLKDELRKSNSGLREMTEQMHQLSKLEKLDNLLQTIAEVPKTEIIGMEFSYLKDELSRANNSLRGMTEQMHQLSKLETAEEAYLFAHGIMKGVQQLTNGDNANARMSEHYYQASASLYNALYHRLSSLERTISERERYNAKGSAFVLAKEMNENKWKLIDKYFVEPDQMICCVCETAVITATAEKFMSEDIYGGGKLVRYKCPNCGAIIGPNKMWNLTEKELDEEYKIHYQLNSEGNTTEAEIATFLSLNPSKGKKYLNYGCGGWSQTIQKMREEGYDVVGFDPYAPNTSEFVINSFDDLKGMKFDGIFSHDLLEHLRFPLDTFKLFADLLNPNGEMAHATACYRYVYEYDRFHLVFYTGDSVEELCKKTGFKVIKRLDDVERLQFNVIYKRNRIRGAEKHT